MDRTEDLLDRLVAEYSDRLASGREAREEELLAEVPAEHRSALERCFRMIRSGMAAAPWASLPLGPGTVLDQFRIVREIGRGGMAVVYEAIQQGLERRVALKILRPGLALEGRHVDRFKREALAIARLKHPHIVQVYAVGEAAGHHFLAMELVEGTHLAEVLSRLPARRDWTAHDLADAAGIPALGAGRTSYESAFCALLAPVVRAIGLAHELGMVHRDIKPANILIHADGRAVIADFGLAKGDGDPGLSLTGEPLGTPFYMSPEQAAVIQHPVDERSDVYSLGVTLYEGLTGRRPFEGDTVLAVIDAIRHRTPQSPRRARRGVSPGADAVVRKAMQRYPEERYKSALDLATELGAIVEGRVTQAAAQEGGALRRLGRALRTVLEYGMFLRVQEYRSRREFLGLPLIHVNLGPRQAGRGLRKAQGWIAIGDVAFGAVALGPLAFGVFSWGGLACGGFVFAGIAAGLVTFAGISIGVLATGGVAAGYAAFGGLALGHYAFGGYGIGAHVLDGRVEDPLALELVRTWTSWW